MPSCVRRISIWMLLLLLVVHSVSFALTFKEIQSYRKFFDSTVRRCSGALLSHMTWPWLSRLSTCSPSPLTWQLVAGSAACTCR